MFFRKIFYIGFVVLVILSLSAPPPSRRAGAESPGTVAILVVDDFVSPLAAVAHAIPADPNSLEQQAIDIAVQRVLEGHDSIDDIINDLANELNELVTSTLGLDAGGPSNDNCVITLEGEDFYTTGGTDVGFFLSEADFYTTGGTGGSTTGSTHGALVQQELNALAGNNPYIMLVPVPITGFKTSQVKSAIDQAIQTTSADNYVINMSFAVTPCVKIPLLVVYDPLMRKLAPQLAGDMDALYQLFQQLAGPTQYEPLSRTSDPLFIYLSGLRDISDARGNPKYVAVAAAGNGSAPYPFYPAALPDVVSVSAGTYSSTTPGLLERASYSNNGNIMLSGDWTDASSVTHHGTTYAAPRYSYRMAMNLIGFPVACDCSTVDPCVLEPLYAVWLPQPPVEVNQTLCSP
jgi:hypothetical protein